MDAARRVFAAEFNRSTLLLESDPPLVVTPGGLACRRLYIVGALVEVKGRRGGVMHARIADPSGGFSLEAGWQQPEVAEVLDTLPIPGFVAVTATACLFQKGSRSSVRVRPETLWASDRAARDVWVMRTAELTLERLERLLAAVRGGAAEPALRAAIAHYGISEAQLRELGGMVESALLSVREEEPPPPSPPREILLALLADCTEPTPIDLLIARAGERGCPPAEAKAALEALLAEGECYMPRRGLIRLA
ncbi:MAG: hypothetical protein QMD46_07645 [Methanomicrobiales archaeon]|nr:hypothetical protein [Methanomicrobiales archaeon]